MRNWLSASTSVLPTLSPPPNTRSLSAFEITTTRAPASSSAAPQPVPYRNGAENIGKKSALV